MHLEFGGPAAAARREDGWSCKWRAAGKGRGAGEGERRGTAPPGAASRCCPGPAGHGGHPTARTGPEAPAAVESRFCAAARAPLSLTLEPAAYLSNSEGNSAAVEGGKNNLSCRTRRKKAPAGPRALPPPCPAQPSPARGLERAHGLSQRPGPHTASPAAGPGTPTPLRL